MNRTLQHSSGSFWLRRLILASLLGLIVLGCSAWGTRPAAAVPPGSLPADTKTIQFNADVRPILSSKCFACHGFDEQERQADLRLDTFEGATAKLGTFAAIVPGKLEDSELWRRVTSDSEDEVMPPPDSHQHLSDAERDVLKRWIEEGAEYQQHWSFEPIQVVDLPTAPLTNGNAIDRFIAARLQQQGEPPLSTVPLIKQSIQQSNWCGWTINFRSQELPARHREPRRLSLLQTMALRSIAAVNRSSEPTLAWLKMFGTKPSNH